MIYNDTHETQECENYLDIEFTKDFCALFLFHCFEFSFVVFVFSFLLVSILKNIFDFS